MRRVTCAVCELYATETGQRMCSSNCSYVNTPKEFQKWVKDKIKQRLVVYCKDKQVFKLIRWGV